MVAKNNSLSEVILTPFDEARVYTFNRTDKIPVHVIEVPGSKFHDFPVCLATANEAELKKLQWAVRQFQCFYEKAAEVICGIKP